MAALRWLLGRMILLLNFIFSPRGLRRDSARQQVIDLETAKLALYQYPACPFCVKVRRAIKRHSLKVETRDARTGSVFAEELRQQGGQLKVPCLRIEKDCGSVVWMYESSDIVNYLEQRFAEAA